MNSLSFLNTHLARLQRFPSPTRPLPLGVMLATLAALATLAMGCSTGARLRGQAAQLDAQTQTIYARAYRCAPRELALARAHTEFGAYELRKGDFVRAREHLTLAEAQGRLADTLSNFEPCLDRGTEVAVVVAPKVEVARAPVDPNADADRDTIPDLRDRCRLEPEDLDGYQDEDGCPDPDNDGDGVPDAVDACPNVPGNVDGIASTTGCPNLDIDGDGIVNRNDNCPTQAEDFDGYQDEDGCPDRDNDGDNLPDETDECPNEAGPVESGGCPRLAQIKGGQIELNQQVFFATDKATILPQSYPLLNEVAQILLDNPQIEIRVEGHTDSRGSAKHNKRLSKERAASVRAYLLGRGIDAARMSSVGYGLERPIDDNNTEEGRANNRRVEIHITKQ